MATARWAYVAVGGALFAAGAYALYHVTPHVQERVAIWLDCSWTFSSACPVYDQGYQLAQSIYAISGGGFFGQGLGRGVLLTAEGNTYIPYLETDFIYAGIAQELARDLEAPFLFPRDAGGDEREPSLGRTRLSAR